MSEPSGRARGYARSYTSWAVRHGRALWVVALLLFVPASVAVARLYANLSGELEDLLPPDAPSVRAAQELRQRVRGVSTLGVVVDAGRPDRVPAAERFIDDLAARVARLPPSIVGEVRVGVAPEERAFFERNAALYIELDDLITLREQLEARKRWEASRAFSALLDDEPPPVVDFARLERKYRDRATGAAAGRYTNAEAGLTLMLIEAARPDAATGRALLERVRTEIAALGGPERYAPGMRVGFSGNIAASTEELAALAADLSVSTIVVAIAVFGVVVLFFRWWRAIAAIMLPLLVGTVLGFGLVTLPPFGVTRMNSSTGFLGSIVVGNGINFGIILLARYMEGRRRGVAVDVSLAEAVWGARPGTMMAALSAAAAYGSLLVTRFQGFEQFGVIGSVGMLMCWLTTFLLAPSLIVALDRGRGALRPATPSLRRARLMDRMAGVVTRHAGVVSGVLVLVTVGSAVALTRFDSSDVETNFSRLRRYDTWTSGEAYWGRKMDRILGRNLTPTIILADSTPQALSIAARLREEIRTGGPGSPAARLLAEVRALDDLVPRDQEARRAELARIERLLTSATRAAIPDDKLADIDRMLETVPSQPVRQSDLPPALLERLTERDGTIGRLVLVYPRLTKQIWDSGELGALIGNVRRVASEGVAPGARPGRVAGSLPISADILSTFRRDGPLASAVSLGAVILIVLFALGGRWRSGIVVASVITGVVWQAALTMVLGVKLSYANFVAFPITFGIGADYVLNVMARVRQEERRGAPGATVFERVIASMGGAVTLCSLTTIIGYSSLLLAKNRGLFLFGLVAVIGEITCLAVAVLGLPAVLLTVSRWVATRHRVAAATTTP